MKANWFHNLENLNWTKLWWIVGILSILWVGLAEIVPANYYRPVSVILMAVQSALLFASRGTKYVVNRTEPPADGKP
jgi:hypothetical protein